MLAKPEYFSPPNEVCCWQGAVKTAQAPRWSCWPGQVLAGRREDCPGAEVELLARASAGRGAVAKSHREATAGGSANTAASGRDCWPGRCGEEAGQAAVAKRLAGRRGEAPSGSNCGRKCQCGSIGKRLLARPLWKSKAASAE